MSNNLPADLQGLPVTYQGKERGVVARDLRGERVKVRFEDGSEEYVPRVDLEVIDVEDELDSGSQIDAFREATGTE